jgi:hypothetical protein
VDANGAAVNPFHPIAPCTQRNPPMQHAHNFGYKFGINTIIFYANAYLLFNNLEKIEVNYVYPRRGLTMTVFVIVMVSLTPGGISTSPKRMSVRA